MSTALVPIDDSDAAMRALQYGIGVYDGIQIINVQPKADVPIVLLRITQEELDNMQLDHGEIVRVAKAEGVDAIVMGTRGMRALGNLALGSTATKVIHLAEVPVTLV